MNDESKRAASPYERLLDDARDAVSPALDPAADSESEQIVRAARDWAREPVQCAPVDLGALMDKVDEMDAARTLDTPVSTGHRWRAVAGTLAAAALFVFALSQVSFTVNVGDTTLQWGASNAAADLTELETQIQMLTDQAVQHASAIETIAIQNAVLQDNLHFAAAQLEQRQRLETAARRHDIRSIIQLASGYQPE